MRVKDLDFKKEIRMDGEDILYLAYADLGRITVLDRMTGFGGPMGGVRDIETGFKDLDGKFWLASGNFDIRRYPEMEIPEAIELIKKSANLCIGLTP